MVKERTKIKYKYIKFFWVTLREFDLNPGRCLLLYLICALAERTGYCYMSKSKLAETLNITSETVYKMIIDLEKRELIRRVSVRHPELKTRVIMPTKKLSDHFEELKYRSVGEGV